MTDAQQSDVLKFGEITEKRETWKPGEPITFKLSTPIQVHSGEMKTEVVLKMPTARAFLAHGNFFRLVQVGTGADAKVTEEFDFKALRGFFGECSGLHAEFFDSLAANDVLPFGYALLRLINTRPQ